MPIGTPTSIGGVGSSPAAAAITFTTTANIVAGNLVVIVIGINDNNSVTISSVSDTLNTYTQAIAANNAGFTRCEFWYCANAQAVLSGTLVTAILSGITGGANAGMGGVQVSGIATTSPLDKTNQNTGTGNISVTTGTLTSANEIVFGGDVSASATGYTGAAGFNNLLSLTINSVPTVLDYVTVSATTSVSYAPTFTSNVSRNGAVVATFLGAAPSFVPYTPVTQLGPIQAQ